MEEETRADDDLDEEEEAFPDLVELPKAKAKGKAKSTALDNKLKDKAVKGRGRGTKGAGRRGAGDAPANNILAVLAKSGEARDATPAVGELMEQEDIGDCDVLADRSTTTRAQRHVFKMYFSTLPIEVQNRFNEARVSNSTGKQAVINAIINNFVDKTAKYNSDLKVKAQYLTQRVQKFDRSSVAENDKGKTRTEMLGILGSESLLNQGVQCGDITEETHHGRKFYFMTEISKKRERGVKETDTASRESDMTLSTENFLSFATEARAMMDTNWKGFALEDTSAGSSSEGNRDERPPDDKAMMKLQESFDGMTRITLHVKRMAVELCRAAPSDSTQEMVNKGMTLCRDLVGPSNHIENMLTSRRESLTLGQVKTALRNAAQTFEQLERFEQEVSLLHKHYCGAKKARK